MWGELLLAVFLAEYSHCVEDQLQLELVSVVFRHGDRSPVGTFPNDLYGEDDWPQGYGQLSVEGMRQEFYLGTILKERYITDHYRGFLRKNYTRVEVCVHSTDYDRTLMSAESQLAGLFPPGDQIFDPSILWQPIPVHTVPKENDTLLRIVPPNCPRYSKLLDADVDSELYMKIEMENEGFFKKLENYTGLENVDLTNIALIHDTLLVESTTPGYEIPCCLDDSDFVKMTELTTYYLSLLYNTNEKQRITAGNWTQKVLSDMKGKASGNEAYKDSKLFLYSAHGTTVKCMMSAMGVWDGQLQMYAAAFIIELLSDKNTGGYFVEMYHRANTSTDEITLLSIPACDNKTWCTLEQFEAFASTLIPDDWQAECGLESGESECSDSKWKLSLMVIILGASLGLVMLLWIGTCVLLVCIYQRLWKLMRYTELQTIVDTTEEKL